jgi:XTP/dITP diphosphohydrolase
MRKLLLASTNPGKLIELQAILQDLDIEFVTPVELGIDLEVQETGETYAENAALKGRAFARLGGLLTLADDSGLEVDALDGQPGLRSHRFVPQPEATDADRRAYLIQRLQGKPPPWKAQFRCVVAITTPSGEVEFAEGICPGEIIPVERGQNGFGYDPIFLLPELGLTMAELSEEQKNRLSHRARAVMAARPILIEKLNISS